MKKLLSIPFLIAISICFLYSCCKKDKPCNQTVTNIEISAEDRSKWAYKGYEELTFTRHPAGDTHTFVGGPITNYTFEVLEGGVECPGKYIKQGRSLVFTSPTLNSLINKIVIKQENDLMSDGRSSDCFVIHPKGTFTRGSTFIKLVSNDSIWANSKWYPNINKLYVKGSPESAYWCYYSPTEGIVQFEFADGEVWRLLK